MNRVYMLASMVTFTVFAMVDSGFAQQRAPVVSPPGTSPSGSVVPAPTAPPFEGVIRPTVDQSTPQWPAQPRAPQGAPNVLFVMLDDFGFAQLGCYGAQGLQTPNIDKLAANGLRYNNFHATPLCSPSRAAFLTGRNHHSCAMGVISEFSTGFPGYNGRMPLSHGMISEILGPAGWSTFALGKWHLTPPEDVNLAANRRWWPLRPWIRPVLRLPGGHDQRIRARPHPGQSLHQAAGDARRGLPFPDRHDRQGAGVHRRREARRARPSFLHVLLPWRHPGSAACSEGVERQVPRCFRQGLGSLSRGDAREADRAGHLPARNQAIAPRPDRFPPGTNSVPSNAECTRGRWKCSLVLWPSSTTRWAAWSQHSRNLANSTTR